LNEKKTLSGARALPRPTLGSGQSRIDNTSANTGRETEKNPQDQLVDPGGLQTPNFSTPREEVATETGITRMTYSSQAPDQVHILQQDL
jgi:hypothetical protein